METKTYENRLREMAENMAKATWDKLGESIKKPDAWNSYLNEQDRQEYISNYLIAARIALSFGAECYEAGLNAKYCPEQPEVTDLTSLGLVPQNSSK